MTRNKFSYEERIDILKKFKRRKITAAQFCKKYNVSRTAIFRWQGLYQDNQHFIPLQIVTTQDRDDQTNLGKSNKLPQKIASPLKLYKSEIVLEFISGCTTGELKTIIEILDVAQ